MFKRRTSKYTQKSALISTAIRLDQEYYPETGHTAEVVSANFLIDEMTAHLLISDVSTVGRRYIGAVDMAIPMSPQHSGYTARFRVVNRYDGQFHAVSIVAALIRSWLQPEQIIPESQRKPCDVKVIRIWTAT